MATSYKIRLKRFNGTDYDTLNLKEVFPSKDYNSSNLYNKLELTKKLDILSKYNEL